MTSDQISKLLLKRCERAQLGTTGDAAVLENLVSMPAVREGIVGEFPRLDGLLLDSVGPLRGFANFLPHLSSGSAGPCCPRRRRGDLYGFRLLLNRARGSRRALSCRACNACFFFEWFERILSRS